jgi:hypothetical protein
LSAELINEPSTLLFNTGLLLFGLQIFVIVVMVNETYKIIVKWFQKSETPVEPIVEDSDEETPVIKKKKRNYYKPKKKSEFPIGSQNNTEKKSNVKPKKDE